MGKGVVAVATAVVAVAAAVVPGTDAFALPIYAARERQACASCHVDPSGGGLRTAFGFDYMKNRHALVPEPNPERWPDLPETQPEIAPGLQVGGDLRILYDALHRRTEPSFPSEASSFFRMQGAAYLSYAPVEEVRGYYNQDAGGIRDLWALLAGVLPGAGYVRMGAFRLPYGLRLEDHTIYQRDDLPPIGGYSASLLGFDPRLPDAGIEIGWVGGRHVVQAALSNGSGASFDIDRNKALTARAAALGGPLMAGLTAHLDSDGAAAVTERRRYGAYGTLGVRPDLVLLGELDLGEDERGDDLNRMLVAWGEADYFWRREARLRLRYEFLDLDRDFEFAASERYTAEIDWMPVPFTTLRVSYRFTSNELVSDLEELLGVWHFYF